MTASASAMYTHGGVALCSPCKSELCFTDGESTSAAHARVNSAIPTEESPSAALAKVDSAIPTEESPSAALVRMNSAYWRRSCPLQPMQEWTLLTDGGVALCRSRPRFSLPIPKKLGTDEKIQLSMKFFSKIVRRFLLHFLITDKLVLITLPRKM